MIYVAPTAVIQGSVAIGEGSSVWHHAVLRADYDPISIGSGSNVQENCIVHTDTGFPTRVGDRVTVGHGAILHGCVVEDDSVIGMGAIVTNGARIGRGSFVGAGAVVPEGAVVPPGSIALGVPARVAKLVDPLHVERMRRGWKDYVRLAKEQLEARPGP